MGAVFGLLVAVVEMLLFIVPLLREDLVADLADLMLVAAAVAPARLQILLKEQMVQQIPAVGLVEELQDLTVVPVS